MEQQQLEPSKAWSRQKDLQILARAELILRAAREKSAKSLCRLGLCPVVVVDAFRRLQGHQPTPT
ncbi:MAG: hypothetical protein ACK5Y2_04995 [Bdellovibrionales bacterium]